jgi:hypothetical protein
MCRVQTISRKGSPSERILRGHTLNTSRGVKIWSDLHGDVES